ncbi:MAG: putative lipid II flippase FtsW [Acidimicrobiia bacterium]|nr:putative lipid II flippase FtsW [Acidimicrobiia bacterium]
MLLVAVVALNLIGLVMVLSASSVTALNTTGSSWYHFQRQGMWFIVALVAMLITLRIDYRLWRRVSAPLLVVALGLLVAVLVPGLGSAANGSQRWIVFGPISVQPSEIAKLAVVVFIGDLLARRSHRIRDTTLSLRPVLVVLVVVAALVLKQPNLGTTLVIGMVAFTMMFIAGVPLAPLSAWASVATGGAVLLAMSADYRRDRVLAFLDPWDDPLNTGYQTIQSLVGIASGGLWGVGLGNGRAKWGFLPFAHTDFIFAVVAEELGFIGALTLIGLFVLLGLVGIRIAAEAPDRFGTLVATGITCWLVVQAFVNMGAVVGVLPITGVPLPFLSAGGSALVVNMTAVGVMLNIARQGRR